MFTLLHVLKGASEGCRSLNTSFSLLLICGKGCLHQPCQGRGSQSESLANQSNASNVHPSRGRPESILSSSMNTTRLSCKPLRCSHANTLIPYIQRGWWGWSPCCLWPCRGWFQDCLYYQTLSNQKSHRRCPRWDQCCPRSKYWYHLPHRKYLMFIQRRT